MESMGFLTLDVVLKPGKIGFFELASGKLVGESSFNIFPALLPIKMRQMVHLATADEVVLKQFIQKLI